MRHFPTALGAALALAAVAWLLAAGSTGCSMGSTEADEELREQRQREAQFMADRSATMSEWRQEWMPKLLAEFESTDPGARARARHELLSSDHTPARRPAADGSIVSTHIRARLEQSDWDSVENRLWFAQEGRVYRQLARFNTSDPEEWRAARAALVAMGPEMAERAAMELLLRLTWPTGESRQGGGGPTRGVDANPDRALWAIENLVAIGEDAVAPLLWGSYHRLRVEGIEQNRFWENIFYTLAEIGAPAIEPLALDLTNSQRLDNEDQRFQRVRRLLRTMTDIFRNIRTPRHRSYVDDLTTFDRERGLAVEAISTVLERYRPNNDLRLYQIRLYAVQALSQIGDDRAVRPLVRLWERAEREGDDDVAGQCHEALISITGRAIGSLAEWRRYVQTLER